MALLAIESPAPSPQARFCLAAAPTRQGSSALVVTSAQWYPASPLAALAIVRVQASDLRTLDDTPDPAALHTLWSAWVLAAGAALECACMDGMGGVSEHRTQRTGRGGRSGRPRSLFALCAAVSPALVCKPVTLPDRLQPLCRLQVARNRRLTLASVPFLQPPAHPLDSNTRVVPSSSPFPSPATPARSPRYSALVAARPRCQLPTLPAGTSLT
ncbi:hypothetical protein POSPLADRAFT_1063047 [Postia placenta MAD-698-R-SB12]|uniref:Uncharacterized protein n=1 Tax=Postia placenta MAD-698-R-SB12 TaxID=670580 RepID=A0A1X6MI77_9APHY|nr:hypothetical protein POSPLADRAFT_1063047 [Postia placenta MAD-698-R-SB12]OSX56048.1 hypothetical protein POSPLADRAFT_1063047 [Postia placenta MAD-698-R-SB12]